MGGEIQDYAEALGRIAQALNVEGYTVDERVGNALASIKRLQTAARESGDLRANLAASGEQNNALRSLKESMFAANSANVAALQSIAEALGMPMPLSAAAEDVAREAVKAITTPTAYDRAWTRITAALGLEGGAVPSAVASKVEIAVGRAGDMERALGEAERVRDAALTTLRHIIGGGR